MTPDELLRDLAEAVEQMLDEPMPTDLTPNPGYFKTRRMVRTVLDKVPTMEDA